MTLPNYQTLNLYNLNANTKGHTLPNIHSDKGGNNWDNFHSIKQRDIYRISDRIVTRMNGTQPQWIQVAPAD